MKVSLQQAYAIFDSNIKLGSQHCIDLKHAVGYVLAEDQFAQINQPPHRASMMDGIGVNIHHTIKAQTQLNLVAEIPAGTHFAGSISPNEAVRVYTGSALPDSVNHVIPQEECLFQVNAVQINSEQLPDGRYIRGIGLDFHRSEKLIDQGTKLTALHCGILASSNIERVNVILRPKVIIITNGEELCDPQQNLQPAQVIDSISYILPHLIEQWGGEVIQILRLKDDFDTISSALKTSADDADFIITVGGASVGKYDYFKDALKQLAGEILFSKVHIRPGQPCWFGSLTNTAVLGLPGNPASAIVCAHLFAKTALGIFLNDSTNKQLKITHAICPQSLQSNGDRDHFVRCKIQSNEQGTLIATVDSRFDSSLLSPFAQANCLLWREAQAKPAPANSIHKIILL